VSRDLLTYDLETRSVYLNNVCNRRSLVQAPSRNRGLNGISSPFRMTTNLTIRSVWVSHFYSRLPRLFVGAIRPQKGP